MEIRGATPGLLIHARKSLLVVMIMLLALGTGCFGSHDDIIPITTNSDQAREYFQLGRDLGEKLRIFEARHYFKKAIAFDSNFALAYLYLASTESNRDVRLQLLDRAASLSENASAGERLMILGRRARYTGNWRDSREYFLQLILLHPKSKRARHLLSNYYLFVHEYEQAIVEYQKAIAIDPQYAPPYNGLGYAHFYLGSYAEAEKFFLKYIELIPNDPNPYDSYADLMMRMGRFSKALDYYQKALRKNPNIISPYLGMASAYNYLGQYDEARLQLETLYDRARTVEHQRMAYRAQAVSYEDEGVTDSALAYLQKAYSLAAKAKDILAMAEDLNWMGHILQAAGESKDALEKYKQAAKLVNQSSLAPAFKEAAEQTFHYNATRVAMSRGNLKTARKYAEKYRASAAQANDPLQTIKYHDLAGMIALAERDYQAALAELNQANVLDPYNLQRRAQAYRGLGDERKAEELEQEAASYFSNNNLNHALIRSTAKETMAAADST